MVSLKNKRWKEKASLPQGPQLGAPPHQLHFTFGPMAEILQHATCLLNFSSANNWRESQTTLKERSW